MWYELWDSETGNRVGKYPTEDAALHAVLEDIRVHGRDSEVVLTLGLLRRDPDDLIAEGPALVERALAIGAGPDRNGGGGATRASPAPADRLLKSALRSKTTPRRSRTEPPAR
jgi:hypothetical protein